MNFGIHAISFDIPKMYLPIETLAQARAIEPEKLTLGLGLKKMTFTDIYQDTVTMAANAAIKLIKQENLQPKEISRIYVGTESGVDSSKPVASFVIQLLEQQLGERTLVNCDAVDLTFACIGAVDALQNSLDFVRLNPNKKAIVIASDYAKYDLGSTGEYTQGAGAVALLVTANPNILSFDQAVGVGTEGVFDFFKPRRTLSKSEITNDTSNPNWQGILESEIQIFKEQPVFDGQYSNQCYTSRIKEAYQHFKQESGQTEKVYEQWEGIFMHLPYCFQGRRTFVEIFAKENPELLAQQPGENAKEQWKALSKSPEYTSLVNTKIAPTEIASGQVGNIYTGSIFLGMLSALSYHAIQKSNITGKKVGFIAYGSGSKSKVFEATIQNDWVEAIFKSQLFETLQNCIPISMEEYEQLHKKERKKPVLIPKQEFALTHIENENPVLMGARIYEWVD
jgi:hydroxymethylglutaryl-CoA synthase